jgi:hypothetical protein
MEPRFQQKVMRAKESQPSREASVYMGQTYGIHLTSGESLPTQPIRCFIEERLPTKDPEYHSLKHHEFTFPINTDQINLRLRPINRYGEAMPDIVQKRIPFAGSWDFSKDRLRIKEFLSVPLGGVTESEWLTIHPASQVSATPMNQFRLRGVSKDHQLSQWVYSEIRGLKNERIVFELLHDLLDTLVNVDDEEIDYLLSHVLKDTFHALIKDNKAKFDYEFTDQNKMTAIINELSRVMAKTIRSSFDEQILSSTEEFTDLIRTYRFSDKSQNNFTDFLTQILEHYLDEHYEDIVKNTEIQVIAQNSAEIQGFVQGLYSFEAKSELIKTMYQIYRQDHFVAAFDDAVKLIIGPGASELFKAAPIEEISKFFRMVVQDLILPLSILEHPNVSVLNELNDEEKLELADSIVKYDLINGDLINRMFLVYDRFPWFNINEENFYVLYIKQLIDEIKAIYSDNIKLLLCYNPHETLAYLLHMQEHFSYNIDHISHHFAEEESVCWLEDWKTEEAKQLRHLKESVKGIIQDWALIKSQPSCFTKDSILRLIREKFRKQDTVQLQEIYEIINQSISEVLNLLENPKQLKANDNIYSSLMEKVQQISNNELNKDEKVLTVFRELLGQLYELHLELRAQFHFVDTTQQDLMVGLSDEYQIKGDEVHYALGDMNSKWPIGKFVLGLNTLSGEN